MTDKGAFTIIEFCRWASIGRTTVYAQIKAGNLKLTKVGSKSLILMSDAQAWLASLSKQNAA